MSQTKAEQETIIRWDEEEQIVHLYSASPKTWRKCAKMGLVPVKETTLAKTGEVSGRFYRFPVALLTWRARRAGTEKRAISPEAVKGLAAWRHRRVSP